MRFSRLPFFLLVGGLADLFADWRHLRVDFIVVSLFRHGTQESSPSSLGISGIMAQTHKNRVNGASGVAGYVPGGRELLAHAKCIDTGAGVGIPKDESVRFAYETILTPLMFYLVLVREAIIIDGHIGAFFCLGWNQGR